MYPTLREVIEVQMQKHGESWADVVGYSCNEEAFSQQARTADDMVLWSKGRVYMVRLEDGRPDGRLWETKISSVAREPGQGVALEEWEYT